MEGTLSSVACLSGKENDCPRRGECQTLPLWTEYNAMVYDFFFSKKLSDLVEQAKG